MYFSKMLISTLLYLLVFVGRIGGLFKEILKSVTILQNCQIMHKHETLSEITVVFQK